MAIHKIYEEFIDSKLKSEFLDLKDKWINEAGYFSNPNDLYNNKYYKEIISMGRKIVPILVEDFESKHSDWFTALSEITKCHPIKKENWGNVPKMKKDWENWYEENYK